MTTYFATPIAAAKIADAKEWSVCAHYNIQRVAHDSQAYDKTSDVNAGEKKISVKSARFTLMSGSLCNGYTEFDDIWDLYAEKTHSNTFAYVTETFQVYEMNIEEFKTFVYEFCKVERESAKNGGSCKIRCKSESKALLKWLADRV